MKSTEPSETTAKVNRKQLLLRLDRRLQEILKFVEKQSYFRRVADPEGDPKLTIALMREIMLEISSYQKPITKALFVAIGRIGNSIEEQKLVSKMIAVQIEEIGHGALALHDYIALGGDEEFARRRRPSPPAQAFIGLIRRLCEEENPLCHLGLFYFLERFTVLITSKVKPMLLAKGYPDERLRFMRLHAQEDSRHSEMVANAIADALERYAGAEEAIEYGFECFAQVYPHPIWQHAYERAVTTLDMGKALKLPVAGKASV